MSKGASKYNYLRKRDGMKSIVSRLRKKGLKLKMVRNLPRVVTMDDGGLYALRISREITNVRKYTSKKNDKVHDYSYDYFVLNMKAIPEDCDGALIVFMTKTNRILKIAIVSKYTNLIGATTVSRDSLDAYADKMLFDVDGVQW